MRKIATIGGHGGYDGICQVANLSWGSFSRDPFNLGRGGGYLYLTAVVTVGTGSLQFSPCLDRGVRGTRGSWANGLIGYRGYRVGLMG